MFTRRMNERITIFSKSGGQNEDGEVLSAVRKDLFSCWAEISKTTVKDFKGQNFEKSEDGLAYAKDTKVFVIRYVPNLTLDNSMFIDFRGAEYSIVSVEIDYASKDIIMIKGDRVT